MTPESMNPSTVNPEEELNTEEIEFEPEGEPEEEQWDIVLIRDGRGRIIEREVPDDD